METGTQQPDRARRRWIVAEVICACIVILVLAQALMTTLSQAAFSTLAAATTAERVELLARDAADRINTGLRLGKPLEQYFGLERQLSTSVQRLSDLKGTAVVMPSGYPLAEIGALPDIPAGLVAAVVDARGGIAPSNAGIQRLGSGAVMFSGEQSLVVGVPLAGGSSRPDGALLLAVDTSAQAAREADYRQRSLVMLAGTTALAAVSLLIVLGWLMPFDMLVRPGGRARIWVPLAALILAQAVYAGHAVSSFRTAWIESTRGNVAMLAQGLQADLNRVLGMGIDIQRMRGVDRVLARLAESLPVIGSARLLDAQGKVLASAGGTTDGALQEFSDVSPDLAMDFPLGDAAGQARAVGTLSIRLDGAVIAAGIRDRVLDAGTVALISAVAVFELFLLLAMLIHRSVQREPKPVGQAGAPDGEGKEHGRGALASRAAGPQVQTVARLARPVMFGFLFAWALPLSFLPVYAGMLPPALLSLPVDILRALPISVEMLCGLCGALLAGRLTDRRGWQAPVLGGLLLVALASVASALATSLEAFIAARGLVGLGYGLAWMGLQGYVVAGSLPGFRGGNMAWLFAGLFAGHLSGSAVGAMLADQAGYLTVFLATAIMVCLPLAGMLALAWQSRRARVHDHAASDGAASGGGALARAASDGALPAQLAPGARARVEASSTTVPCQGSRRSGGSLRTLLFSRDFGVLLAASVVPFSVAQVGLLYFALPLYLQEQGVSASGTGRVLMLYGMCMIYLGPLIGRVVDRSGRKKAFVALGGILGGAGMAYLYVDNSLAAVSLAVFLLAFGSCWTGAAQTSWMLALPRVQAYGAGGATSVMRAADKFGQMAGPLFVGTLFTMMGIASGLAITGLAYMLAAIAFALVAPAGPEEDMKRPGRAGSSVT